MPLGLIPKKDSIGLIQRLLVNVFFFFYQKQICLFFKKMFLSVDMIELIGFDRVNIFLV
jgi:hypothetical protein